MYSTSIRATRTILIIEGKPTVLAAGKISEAYCRVDWKYGFFRLGRLNRNWGPFPTAACCCHPILSPTTLFEFQIASSFFEFRHLFCGVFPTIDSSVDAAGNSYDRYLSAHSLNFMLGGLGSVGIMETMLFARSSGLPDLQLVNPFSIYTVINTNGGGGRKPDAGLCSGDLCPIARHVSLKGQIILDDFQVDNKGPYGPGNPRIGEWTWGVYVSDVFPITLPHTISLEYR